MMKANQMPSRLRPLPPEGLAPDQRALYDAIAHGPRAQGPQHFPLLDEAGALRGPFNAMLLSPALGSALQDVGAAIRFGGSLPPRARELAILVVSHHWDADFERESHEAVGRAIGLSDDELVAVRAGDAEVFTGDERLVMRVAGQLVAGDLDDALWAEASAALGASTIYDLTVLVGYYAMLALQLRVFRVGD